MFATQTWRHNVVYIYAYIIVMLLHSLLSNLLTLRVLLFISLASLTVDFVNQLYLFILFLI